MPIMGKMYKLVKCVLSMKIVNIFFYENKYENVKLKLYKSNNFLTKI